MTKEEFDALFGTSTTSTQGGGTNVDSSTNSTFATSLEEGINSGSIKSTSGNLQLLSEKREAARKTQTDAQTAYKSSLRVLGAIDTLASPNEDLFGVFGDTKLDAVSGRSGRLPEAITGFLSNAVMDGSAAMDMIRGDAFLKAFTDLKGGGQISNAEGDKAQQARTTLIRQPPASDATQRKALQELREITESIKKRNDPNNPMRILPDGTLVPLDQYLELVAGGAGTKDIVTGETVNTQFDLTDQGLTQAQIKAQWDAAPSGAVFILNEDRRIKP